MIIGCVVLLAVAGAYAWRARDAVVEQRRVQREAATELLLAGGFLSHAEREFADAEAAFAKVLELAPDHEEARIGRFAVSWADWDLIGCRMNSAGVKVADDRMISGGGTRNALQPQGSGPERHLHGDLWLEPESCEPVARRACRATDRLGCERRRRDHRRQAHDRHGEPAGHCPGER